MKLDGWEISVEDYYGGGVRLEFSDLSQATVYPSGRIDWLSLEGDSGSWWDNELSIHSLYGRLCKGQVFHWRHVSPDAPLQWQVDEPESLQWVRKIIAQRDRGYVPAVADVYMLLNSHEFINQNMAVRILGGQP